MSQSAISSDAILASSDQGRSQDISKGEPHWVIQRVLTRLSPEYCGLFAYKKAYKGGITGTPGPPPLDYALADGSIDTSSTRRQGIVAFYIAHSIRINGEQCQHVFAVVWWYQFDENKDYFGKPVQVWKLNKYASCGPALFMPVQVKGIPSLKLQVLASLCYNCFIDSCNICGAFGCYHFALFN